MSEAASLRMKQSFDTFSLEVEQFAKGLMPKQVLILQKKIALEALARVVQKTPVDTGRARGNWQVTVGTPAEGELAVTGRVEPASSGLAALKPFDVVYIVNNVDYIIYLEGGSSGQAPAGMVAVTVEELRSMFK